ncbi:hypothetical protein E8E13_001428 [Curvularia kusanoi]|uniref:Uncharacterized protein n=1 Tax=Curvularia kusanoi TaxID=90978 RepID=A0A9P4W8F0_CURKU|nr:hypothetical protein E8E13_001428 [Curvularia kusanoi]
MPAIHATTNEGVRELQRVTAAFLTDQYSNGEFVANADDIAELQEATAAFLADQDDGEQCLLPIPTAVARARFGQDTMPNTVFTSEENLQAQLSSEDMLDISFQDTSAGAIEDDRPVVYTSFADILGPPSLPQTPPCAYPTPTLFFESPSLGCHESPSLGTQITDGLEPQYPYVSLEGILKFPDEIERILAICDNEEEYEGTDNDVSDILSYVSSDFISDVSNVAYDGPDALCRTHASCSAAFFDPNTETTVAYASLDCLLGLAYRDDDLVDSYSASNFENTETLVEHDAYMHCDTYSNSSEIGYTFFDDSSDDDDTILDGDSASCQSITSWIDRSVLELDTDLLSISGGDELSSVVSGPSIDFTNYRGSLIPLTIRRPDFLDDEIPSPTSAHFIAVGNANHHAISRDGDLFPAPLGKQPFESFSNMFTDAIWDNEPELALTIPSEQLRLAKPIEFELELTKILTNVLQTVRSRSWADLPTFATELKRELHLMMGKLQTTVSAEHLEDSVHAVLQHMVATGEFDSLVC